MPDGCDLVAAGALPVAFGTSHVALVHRAKLGPGQVCFGFISTYINIYIYIRDLVVSILYHFNREK